MKRFTAFLLIAALLTALYGCENPTAASEGEDLMKEISAGGAGVKAPDDKFISDMADFSIELFKKSIIYNKNSLVSPLSVMLALAMTANGAAGETLTQMEKLLGGGISLAELNEYLNGYVKALPSGEKSKLGIANSIWFRDDDGRLRVNGDFLQKNADYYRAAAYKSAFDEQTVKDINSWIKTNTDGIVEEILSEIKEEAMLYLINAVVFDAEWQHAYSVENIRKGDFTDIDGTVKSVDFMHSVEYSYLGDGGAAGFIKPYFGGDYSFAALLPNENITIGEYIASLTGAGFINTIKNARSETVYAEMPKFEYAYTVKMNETLASLGMPDAFDADKADFEKMAVSGDNLYIEEVLHKTYISVDELGTKAGAVTMVGLAGGGATEEPKTVRLDRPFVYAIIDNATSLPVFIGILTTLP